MIYGNLLETAIVNPVTDIDIIESTTTMCNYADFAMENCDILNEADAENKSGGLIQAILNIINKIKDALKKAIDWIKAKFNEFVQKMGEFWASHNALDSLSGKIINKIVDISVFDKASDIVNRKNLYPHETWYKIRDSFQFIDKSDIEYATKNIVNFNDLEERANEITNEKDFGTAKQKYDALMNTIKDSSAKIKHELKSKDTRYGNNPETKEIHDVGLLEKINHFPSTEDCEKAIKCITSFEKNSKKILLEKCNLHIIDLNTKIKYLDKIRAKTAKSKNNLMDYTLEQNQAKMEMMSLKARAEILRLEILIKNYSIKAAIGVQRGLAGGSIAWLIYYYNLAKKIIKDNGSAESDK